MVLNVLYLEDGWLVSPIYIRNHHFHTQCKSLKQGVGK